MPSPVVIGGIFVVVSIIAVLIWYFVAGPGKSAGNVPSPEAVAASQQIAAAEAKAEAAEAKAKSAADKAAADAKAAADKAKAEAEAKAKAEAEAKAKAAAPVGAAPVSAPIVSKPAVVPLDPTKLSGPYTVECVARSDMNSKTGGFMTTNNLADDGAVFLSKKSTTNVQWVFQKGAYKGSSKNIYTIRCVAKAEDGAVYSWLSSNGDMWDTGAVGLWRDAAGSPGWWEVTPVDNEPENTFTIRNVFRSNANPAKDVVFTYSYLGKPITHKDTDKSLELLTTKDKDTPNVYWKIKLV
jgi:hypothetical protein